MIIFILDDLSVSWVMKEVGFFSMNVKFNLEDGFVIVIVVNGDGKGLISYVLNGVG